MFKIITKCKGREPIESHFYSTADVLGHLCYVMSVAVAANRGFVFMEDVGASAPAIKFNDGETINVLRA